MSSLPRRDCSTSDQPMQPCPDAQKELCTFAWLACTELDTAMQLGCVAGISHAAQRVSALTRLIPS